MSTILKIKGTIPTNSPELRHAILEACIAKFTGKVTFAGSDPSTGSLNLHAGSTLHDLFHQTDIGHTAIGKNFSTDNKSRIVGSEKYRCFSNIGRKALLADGDKIDP